MSELPLPAADFEAAYDLLAAVLDRIGSARESEFLVRLARLLMQAPPAGAAISRAITAAEAAMH